MLRKIFTLATTATLAVTLVAGCRSGNDANAAGPSPTATATAPTSSGAPSTPAAPAPPAATTPPAAPPTSPTKPPVAKPPAKLKNGAKGDRVVALQQRLNTLGYWNGKADGKFGSVTQQAVFALQKAAGIGRDGVVGPKTQKALDRGVRPKARSGKGRVVEIDKKRQLLLIVQSGQVTQIFNMSTGSGQNYGHQGNTYLASTPSGHFVASRQIDGWRHGPLGDLWRPKYFNGGIAVHGAPSVPPYPASHGCARVSNAAMNWIWATNKLPLRTKVWVY
jgi:peptidoglycan hydrolase-like protein with peptidoglycan-binding domain